MTTIDDVQSPADEERRNLLTGATAAAGGLALAGASLPFLASPAPSERARAQGAPVEAGGGGAGARPGVVPPGGVEAAGGARQAGMAAAAHTRHARGP